MSNSNHAPVCFPLGVSRKKSDTSGFKVFKRPPKLIRTVPSSVKKEAAAKKLAEFKPACHNRLLAGCMAHEFLTEGTLLGQKFDPARAEAAPLAVGKEKKKAAMTESSSATAPKPINQVKKHASYAEVANLLKSDAVHIPGIVNPTQLSQWLQQI